ncbi:MAG: tetratricopeptide repeat protein, partial [Candidatus Deferrimicrobiota bacterium]
EDKARSLNPREVRYTLRLSWLFLELFRLRLEPSDTMMALSLAESALRINPYGVEALWQRAEVLEALGRREEAVKDMETAVSVEPNFCRGYAKLVDLARRTDPAEASRWSGKEEECRGKAATLHLEEHEKWLVESPEAR